MLNKLLSPVLISLSLLINGCNAQTQTENKSIKLIETIPLPDVGGRIDHLSFDGKHQIVFVAALGNNTIEVVDLKSKKVIRSIKNLKEPQGVVYLPESNSLFVANGDNGVCDIFNADSFQKTKSIKLAGDADNVRYDSVGKIIYVGYGDGGIAMIDAISFDIITEIKLTGHPESFQLDKTANRIYVNVPDENQIEVIDLRRKIVTERWKIIEASSNFPMSLDESNHRLFVGCRHSPMLLVIDTQSGKTISSYGIDRDVDDIYFNKSTNEIYLSCGAGFVDVFKQTDENTYTSTGKISTHSGARTSLLIPELNYFVIASPSGFNSDASLSIYSIK